MDNGEIINTAKNYADLVCKNLSASKIVLLGSYAKGTATENSDIDIAVIFNEIPDDYFGTYKTLNRLTRGIDNRIEPVMMDTSNDKSGFLTTVLKTGIILYENKNRKRN